MSISDNTGGMEVSFDATSGYTSPNGRFPVNSTTLDSLFSDDFGGSAVDTTKWDVLDGGLAANSNLGFGTLTQTAIGTTTTGITDSVSGSNLVVTMGTTNQAERWYLSKQTFAGKEDIFLTMQKSQANANNSIFVGIVEVDPATKVPVLNPNLANDFRNRGGVEFGASATATAYTAQAVGDSSGSVASGVLGVATAWTTSQEVLIEVDSRDIIASTASVDAITIRAAGATRVSSQCPNDSKLYKLLLKFKNTGVPTATTVTIGRVLVVDNYEQRVQVSTGEGDGIAIKAIAANIMNTPAVTLATTVASLNAVATSGAGTYKDLQTAATTNATSVKATAGVLNSGLIRSRRASECWVKFFNKASAPTVGTDVPIFQIGIPANGTISLVDMVGAYGAKFTTGIALSVTGAYGTADTTAVAAADLDIELIYT